MAADLKPVDVGLSFCRDCEHYSGGKSRACNRSTYRKYDLVTGVLETHGQLDARAQREATYDQDKCGPTARFFRTAKAGTCNRPGHG
jgi:hypothetical protein